MTKFSYYECLSHFCNAEVTGIIFPFTRARRQETVRAVLRQQQSFCSGFDQLYVSICLCRGILVEEGHFRGIKIATFPQNTAASVVSAFQI